MSQSPIPAGPRPPTQGPSTTPLPTVSMAGASRQGCQTGVGGSVVTHNPTDLCVLGTSCPMLPPPPVRRLGADLIRSLSALVV